MRHIWASAVLASALVSTLTLSACMRPADNRMGMVEDESTGLMYGSAIQDNLVTDPTFFTNPKIKVRTRNTSGDTAFELTDFQDALQSSYTAKGYPPPYEEDFGLVMDVNVMYSGQIQTNRAMEYALIGSLLGSTYGGSTPRGIITGTVLGSELGNIIGRFDSQETYMVVANVTFLVVQPYRESQRRITFSHSEKLKDIDDPDEEEIVIRRKIRKRHSTQVAVYAGGRNVSQSEIAEEVRQRMVRIVADFI